MRDAVFFTAPPLLLLLYVTGASLIAYQRSLQFDDWWSRGRHAREFFEARLGLARAFPRASILRQRMDPRSDEPGIIRLSIPRDAWGEIHDDPLAGWGRWVDASLMQGNDLLPVDVRKRGDTSVHWTTEKRSFTIRTPRDRLFKGFRRAGVSAKDVLPSYLANRLAAEFDVLVPFMAIAPVFLNDQFYGVFRFVENVDESFLRRVGRMPGNIFRADAAERSEYYKGLRRRVFMNPYIWDRTAVNEVPGVRGNAALLELVEAVNGSTFEEHQRLMELVDRRELAHALAAMLVVGDPYHMSDVHNQFWYEDPATGRLHPILWDLRILELDRPPARLNMFWRAALRDPFLVDETLRALHLTLAGGPVESAADRLIRDVYDRYGVYLEYDRLRRGAIPDVGSPDEALEVLGNNLRALDLWTRDSGVLFHASSSEHGEILIDLQTTGYAGSDLQAITLRGTDEAEFLRLYADRNGNGLLDPGDREVGGGWLRTSDGWRFELATSLPLLAGWSTDDVGVRPGAVHYRLFLARQPAGIGPDGSRPNAHVEVWPELRNRLTGASTDVKEWWAGAAASSGGTWHPWRYPERTPSTVRLTGVVHLTTTLEIPPGGELVIEPGTRVRLDPDVSVLSYGKVIAKGTREKPISFEQAADGSPWGTVAVLGSSASGSVFEHVRFAGGGGAVIGRVEYSGMVSVHLARDVRFQHVAFVDNLRSDDGLHAVYAGVTLRDCTFRGANGDAIDFDHSTGEIRACEFESSGNDAIDLMGSDVSVIGNRIEGSGDKGISIGEASDPLIFNNRIVRCARGIEVKDRSRPLLLHNLITDNQIGVLQQVKNWRYGWGGWATFVRNTIAGNGVDLRSDGRSRSTRLGGSGELSIEVPPWLYATHGIAAHSGEAGPLEVWSDAPSVTLVASLSFHESLDPELKGWQVSGGVDRINVRNRSLVAWIRGAEGTVSRSVDWDLADPLVTYQAVLEIATHDVRGVLVRLRSESGDVTLPLRPAMGSDEFELFTLDLPRRRYTALEILVDPLPNLDRVDPATGFVERGAGRLELRAARLYAVPQLEPSP